MLVQVPHREMVDPLLDLPWPFPCPVCGPVAPFYGLVCEACKTHPRILPRACRAAIIQQLTLQIRNDTIQLNKWIHRSADLERAYTIQPPTSLRDLRIHQACVREASFSEFMIRRDLVVSSQTMITLVWVFRMNTHTQPEENPSVECRRLATESLNVIYLRAMDG